MSRMQRAATAGSFRKGHSGNPGGKPRGTLNKLTVEARAAASRIVDDPDYRAALTERMISGRAGQMEVMLWQYAKGKPPGHIEVGAPGAFDKLTDSELKERLVTALGGFK